MISNKNNLHKDVYGGLDLHGMPRNVTWTRLDKTATSGSYNILLKEAVDWTVYEKIVISTTSYSPEQTEIM